MSSLEFNRPQETQYGEKLTRFINEVALQAAILLVERHLSNQSEFERARRKQRLVAEFTKLLNENDKALAVDLFSPQEAVNSAKNVSYYEGAAKKLADMGEKLWKK